MAESTNSRLEAFCDGVFAIALTLLIIDIKIPATETLNSDSDLWLSIRHICPSILAFLLSFIIILISWVNHHNVLKLVNKSSPMFIYANGFLLLTVVIIPFPTSLVGDTLLTNHAAPAIVLYNAVFALQAIGWNLICRAALAKHHPLTKNEYSHNAMNKVFRESYFAFIVYSAFAILAFWFPLAIAAASSALWLFWLIYGISLKAEEV